MAEDQDDSQKTEEPTQRRIEEAVKKGQVVNSREVTNFLMLALLALLVWLAMPSAMEQATSFLRKYIESPHEIRIDPNSYRLLFTEMFKGAAMILVIPIIATIFVAFISAFIQHGWIASLDSIMPKLEKISPLKGLKRLFSLRSLVEFLKGVIKLTIVGSVAVIAIWPELGIIRQMHDMSMAGIMGVLHWLAIKMLIGVCAAMAVIAVLDFLYQRFEYFKSLRMSKQDIKDEFKQSEGNPEVKAKLRQMRMERAQKRMMSAVPTADVVVTNPTHFAVALKYDTNIHAAPHVVAKGQDNVAFNIRTLAEENNVPIVRNPPLARALYETAELDEQIPEEHFKAVAEVIAYVYKLKGQG